MSLYNVICSLDFVVLYFQRTHKKTKSYPNTIRNYGVKLSKSDKK